MMRLDINEIIIMTFVFLSVLFIYDTFFIQNDLIEINTYDELTERIYLEGTDCKTITKNQTINYTVNAFDYSNSSIETYNKNLEICGIEKDNSTFAVFLFSGFIIMLICNGILVYTLFKRDDKIKELKEEVSRKRRKR